MLKSAVTSIEFRYRINCRNSYFQILGEDEKVEKKKFLFVFRIIGYDVPTQSSNHQYPDKKRDELPTERHST